MRRRPTAEDEARRQAAYEEANKRWPSPLEEHQPRREEANRVVDLPPTTAS